MILTGQGASAPGTARSRMTVTDNRLSDTTIAQGPALIGNRPNPT